MERKPQQTDSKNQIQPGSGALEIAEASPLIVRSDKKRRQTRVLRTLAIRTYCEESRKTPVQKAAILRRQALRNLPLQRAIKTEFGPLIDSSTSEPALSASMMGDSSRLKSGKVTFSAPLSAGRNPDELDSDNQTTSGIHAEVLASLAEDENKVPLGYHHLETKYFPSNPEAPRNVSEDNYGAESWP